MNWLRTDGLEQVDLNIQKSFFITESFKALFRLDLLNAPNNQVLADPSTDPTSTSFGRITGFDNTPRYIQFQLRLTF
jgi:hypothetical protein